MVTENGRLGSTAVGGVFLLRCARGGGEGAICGLLVFVRPRAVLM